MQKDVGRLVGYSGSYGSDICPRCESVDMVFDHISADVICTTCGVVVGGRLFGFDFKDRECMYSWKNGYKRSYYLHEKFKQICNSDVKIPPDLLDLVKKAYETIPECKRKKRLKRSDIRSLLRHITIPTPIGRKYKNRKGRPLRTLTRLVEKWKQIAWELGSEVIIPNGALLERIEEEFVNMGNVHEGMRHVDGCHRNPDTCVLFGCRKNFPASAALTVIFKHLFNGKFSDFIPDINDQHSPHFNASLAYCKKVYDKSEGGVILPANYYFLEKKGEKTTKILVQKEHFVNAMY